MRMDIDTIVYILISIAILVFSGLRSAQKKKAQRLQSTAKAPPVPERDPESEYGEESEITFRQEAVPPQPLSGLSSIERLGKLLSGEMDIERISQPYKELIPDEDEIIYEAETEPRKEPVDPVEENAYVDEDLDDTGDEDSIPGITRLFKDKDEIKRAIIYNEIFKRKYT